ncbi:MAG: hypothetical protein M3R00_08085, partial [Pseudomonadota bacterium]|nr:hypothetical protein [Pseudomonadota bacterium]
MKRTETSLEDLEAFIQKKPSPSWQARLAYVVRPEARFAEKHHEEVIKVLIQGPPGLKQNDANSLIVGLIRHEWDRVKNGKQNDFMRLPSIYKKAMMHYYTEEIRKQPHLVAQYFDNPISFIGKMEIPQPLKSFFAEIVNDKISNDQDLRPFAHAIVFSMVNGPMIDALIKQVPTAVAESTAVSTLLTDINKMFNQNNKSPEERDKAAKEIIMRERHEIFSPDQAKSYAQSLDNLMKKISPTQYRPGQIKFEVINSLNSYKQTYDKTTKPKVLEESGKVASAIYGVADSLKRRFKKTKDVPESIIRFDDKKPVAKKRPIQEWVEG